MMKADQDVSPDSELAVQVYIPVSEAARSEERERLVTQSMGEASHE